MGRTACRAEVLGGEGVKEGKVSPIGTGNQLLILGKVGAMNISIKGICLGGIALLTERSKAGPLVLSLWSRSMTMFMT